MTCTFCGSPLPQGAMFCGECGRAVTVTRSVPSVVAAPVAVEPVAAEPVEVEPVSVEPIEVLAADPVPVEVAPPSAPERFILQFSTGESVAVTGNGIIGRNPHPEPGEYFDTLVPIVDPGKSVSKTHLEFGQDDGAFWVADRYSGNGSGIRLTDQPRVPCTAGRRYVVPRGGRVDIGDQFFVVS